MTGRLIADLISNTGGQKSRLEIDAPHHHPTKVGIHVFADSDNNIRGWWAFAHHDAIPPVLGLP